MNINEVLKEELKLISISKEEEGYLVSAAKEVVGILEKAGFDAKIGGSLAKGTVIKKAVQDIDIFITFNSEEEISKLSAFLDKSKFDIQKIHGSRDYFHILLNSSVIELIPIVRFDEPALAKNVTDFSLLHVTYVLKKLRKKKIWDQIKLAKTFCHAQNCYGAESYIKGFSGYALELLILHYGSFTKFLKEMVKARVPIVLDSEKKFKNSAEVLRSLNESKLLSPVILVDPTYKFRNVTAGLSNETFEKFVLAAKSFLKKPSLDFFSERLFDEKKFQRRTGKNRFMKIIFTTDKQEGDIAATKMKKFFDFIVYELERKEQKVIEKEFVYNGNQEATGYLIVKESKEVIVRGPPVNMKDAVVNFKKFNKNAVVKGKFVYAKKKVSLNNIFSYLKNFEKEMDVRFCIL